MRRSLSAALLLAAAVALHAAPANAERAEATSGEVVAAMRQCVSVTGPNGVDLDTLVADGWMKGTMRGGDGKSVRTDVGFYARAGNDSMVMTGPGAEDPNGVCFVVARIGGTEQYYPIANAITAACGAKPFSKEGNTLRWMNDEHLIQLDATGTREKFSVRVSVAAVSQESK